jgi:hypothetical protein
MVPHELKHMWRAIFQIVMMKQHEKMTEEQFQDLTSLENHRTKVARHWLELYGGLAELACRHIWEKQEDHNLIRTQNLLLAVRLLYRKSLFRCP